MDKLKDIQEVYVCTDTATLLLLRTAWEKEKMLNNGALANEEDKTLVDRALRFYIGHWLQK